MKRCIGVVLSIVMLIMVLFSVPMVVSADNDIKLNDKNLRWIGRTSATDNGVAVGWGMTELTFNMKGRSARVKISTGQEAPGAPYFAIYINENFDRKIKIEKGSKWYELADNLNPDRVTNIRLVKTNEVWMTATVEGLSVDGSLVENTKRPERLIEVVGDSISAAYGILSSDDNAPDDTATDATYGYAAALAKKLGAELNLVANSGKGVYCNSDGKSEATMPFLYKKKLPSLNYANWNHSVSNPDLIIVNLGTNDEFGNAPKKKFEASVTAFLKYLTETHPTTQIVWTYGLMNNAMTESLKTAVESFAENNKNVHFIPLPDQETLSSAPTSKADHPNVEVNKKAADYLYEKLDEMGIITAMNNRVKEDKPIGTVGSNDDMIEYQVDNRPKPVGVAPEDEENSNQTVIGNSQSGSQVSGETDSSPKEPSDKADLNSKAENKSGIIIYVIIGATELIALAAVIVIIIKKKKSK